MHLMKYTDFYSHLLNESMTTSLSGANYESKDLENLLGISFILGRKVLTPVFNEMSEFEKEYFQANRSMEIITPDGPDTFSPTGTLNFYTNGFSKEGVDKVIKLVKEYLPKINLTLKGVRGPEKSGMYKSEVVRFDISKNDNVGQAENVPEINMSNANARIVYGDVLGLPDFEEGYSIEAIELYNRIKDVLEKIKKDPDYLKKSARLPSMDVGDGGAMMYTGALRSEDIVARLHQIANLCQYGMKHGHNKVVIG